MQIASDKEAATEYEKAEGYRQFEYISEEMKDLFAAADLVISRAGANSICELLALRKPHILVPLPATASRGERAVASIVSFVNDKLTIKKPPVKDKTIRAFPFRSSMSAFLSAVAACSFLICFCVVGIRLISNTSPELDEAYITEYAPELEETVSVDYEA